MATWPATLPQIPLVDGYSETLPETAIRTSMDVGPAKVRQRISHNVRPFVFPMWLTSAQIDILETLYATTCLGGALPFTHDRPRAGGSVEIRFTAPPQIGAPQGDYYPVDCGMEVLP